MTNSIRKGKRGEREFARWLTARGYDARRGVQYQGGPDSPDVVGLPGCHIEVKRWDRVTDADVIDFLRQAIDDAAPDEIPIVAYREDFARTWRVATLASHLAQMVYRGDDLPECVPSVLVMTADDFMAVYKHWRGE